MLDVDTAAPFLLQRGLIETQEIIDGSLKIWCEARRNRNLRVEGSQGKGFLIKQPDDPSHGGPITLRTEANFHRFCENQSDLESLRQFIPRLIDDDPEISLLVFELIAEAAPFQSWIVGAKFQASAAALELGTNLATLHRSFRAEWLRNNPELAELPRKLPWATTLHRPGTEMLALLSAANYQTLQLLQTQDGLAQQLDRLRDEWRPETVIHGDMKFDNILVQTDQALETGSGVKTWIVDWEMVQIGDPAWDLAGVLQGFLTLWVQSMPMNEDLPSAERTARARVPLEELRGASRAFWEGYLIAADLAHRDADELLRRSVVYSAARLIQTAYEMLFTAHELSGPPVLLLQMAANILGEPLRAQVQLYGIPLYHARP